MAERPVRDAPHRAVENGVTHRDIKPLRSEAEYVAYYLALEEIKERQKAAGCGARLVQPTVDLR
jgi:hypothetical protein